MKELSSSLVADEGSQPQRPRRNVMLKNLEYNSGLLWKEEKELKKALYASLQESKKCRNFENDYDGGSECQLLSSDGSAKQKNNGTGHGEHAEGDANASPKRAKVHAQRKFAQGSNPNSPAPTPVKFRNNSGTAVDLLPSKRPKTEDFLMFLCLRGTSILPKSLDFFGLASKSDMSCDSRCPSPVSFTADVAEKQKPVPKPNSSKSPLRNGKHTKGILNRHFQTRSKEKPVVVSDSEPADSDADESSHGQPEKARTRNDWNRRNGETVHKSSSGMDNSTNAVGGGKGKALNSVQALKQKYQQQRLAKQKVAMAQAKKVKDGENKAGQQHASPAAVVTASPVKTQPIAAKPDKCLRSGATLSVPVTAERSSPSHSESTSVRYQKTITQHTHCTRESAARKSVDTRPVTRNSTMMTRSLREVLDRAAFEASKVAHKGAKLPPKNAASAKKAMCGPKSSKLSRKLGGRLSDFSSDDDEPLAKKAKPVALTDMMSPEGRLLRSCVVDLGKRPDSVRCQTPASPVSGRPTRKTKEAATAYLEILRDKYFQNYSGAEDEPKPRRRSADKDGPVHKKIHTRKEDTFIRDHIQTRANKDKILNSGDSHRKTSPRRKSHTVDEKSTVKKRVSPKSSSETSSPGKSTGVLTRGKERVRDYVVGVDVRSSSITGSGTSKKANVTKVVPTRRDLRHSGCKEDSIKAEPAVKAEPACKRNTPTTKTSDNKLTKKSAAKSSPITTVHGGNSTSKTGEVAAKGGAKSAVAKKQATKHDQSDSDNDDAQPNNCEDDYKHTRLLTDFTSDSFTFSDLGLRDGGGAATSFVEMTDFDDVHVGETTSIAVKENVLSNSVAIQVNMVDDMSDFEDDILELTGSDFGSENSLSLERILTPSCFADSRPSSANRLDGLLFPGSNVDVKYKSPRSSDTTSTSGKSRAKSSAGQETPPGKRRGRPLGKRTKADSIPVTPATLIEAPTFTPTLEEFQDPLEYIARIRPEAEKFGICRIIPPPSFKPECKVNDEMRFTAHNQYIHKMLHRIGPSVKQMTCIQRHLESQGGDLEQAPLIGGMELDLPRLYQVVEKHGGLREVTEKNKWQKIADSLCIPKSAQDRVTKLYDAYCKYLLSYGMLTVEERQRLENQVEAEYKRRSKNKQFSEGDECVTMGRSMCLSGFYRIARNTMAMWFKQDPSSEEVEQKYWNLVSEGEEHVCVHTGNVDSSVYGYGFPVNKNSPFAKHPWNLKVLTNNQDSVLRSMGPVMGVTIPTLHLSMLFTTGCWYRDPHCLPWIEYLHTGASKVWYGVPADRSEQFREAMSQEVPEYSTQHPIWLPSDTAMVPPNLLLEHGVSLCRVVQESGHFVVVFPKAFTSTIGCGYSVSESVYFAHDDWLQMAQEVFQEIRESCEPTVFPLERLLFSIATDNRSPPDVLQKIVPMLEQIRDTESSLRMVLHDLGIKTVKRVPHTLTKERRRGSRESDTEMDFECDVCQTKCYVSVVVQPNEDVVLCLMHAVDRLQRNRRDVKSFELLHTRDQAELNDMVSKVEERISSAPTQKKTTVQKKTQKKKQVA